MRLPVSQCDVEVHRVSYVCNGDPAMCRCSERVAVVNAVKLASRAVYAWW